VATPFLAPAFVTGELSPSVFGRVDLDREHVAASTMRNLFVNYRGGAYSRAGTSFVGFSKQTGRDFPPRLIPFQFNINQGLALEFGHEYMRVILDGAFVVETPISIGGASQADPAVLTFGAEGASAATPNNAAVTFSYAPGDLVTLAGGTELTPAVLAVTTSELVSILAKLAGTGYAINDTITLAGGTSSTSAIAKVASVIAVSATGFVTFSVNPSDGDTVTLNGVAWTFKTAPTTVAQTQIQSTLAGTLAQLAADLNASANGSLTVATYSSTPKTINVAYTATGTGGNAYTLAASVAVPSAGTLTGGTTTGIGLLTINTAGVFSALPASGNMTQSATSGGGAGASFQTAVFGPHAVTIANPGAYNAVPANPVVQDSTTGVGMGATFTTTWIAVAPFNNGDWIYIQGVSGMTELNGNTYAVAGATATTVELLDVYGNFIDASGFLAYAGGGTAARIYTLATPYSEQDLPYLKFTQSADVMTLCCVNQATGAEYEAQDLSRISDTDWVFSDVVATPSVAPPSGVAATISNPSGTTFYGYEVTAVSPDDGSESIASSAASVEGVNIGTTAGQVNVTWKQIAGVNEYNIYKAQPSTGTPIPGGSLFGYIGSAYGAGFTDSNIVADYAQVPPRHYDPFARGQIFGVVTITGGTGYTTATTSVITTATGAGANIGVIVQNGAVVGFIVGDSGHDYQPGDTIAISGAGSGATASLQVGPESGTYPSVPGYFQERRVYGNTLNQTDTYFMSQPGAFTNFDSRIPPIDTDAIIGSPWSVQVNGIQWMIQTSGGLLVMTGSSAWLLVGAGTFATNVQAISPSSQDDVPQAFTGVSPIVPPIKINYDVLYVNSKGSYYFALPYQLYVPPEPIDLTELATHLFTDFSIRENAWCEQPFKLLWAVRDDGVLLSLTYYKTQAVSGWARHDTNGLFESVCSVTEPPVDALYLAAKRFPGDNTAYMIERMNNRIWSQVEDVWAVDAGLALPQATPNATLTADSTYGVGSLTGVTGLVGGTGYSAGTTAAVVDDNGDGPGSGAVPALTIVGGVITAVVFAPQGSGYVNPRLDISDPANTGSGASARPILNTLATFTADGPAFGSGAAKVGDVIRMGGGIASITNVIDAQTVLGTLLTPITALLPNSGGQVAPQKPGSWTLTTPVTVISGLGHLIGATVTGLADGNVITPRTVQPDGTITLDAPASSITVGLGFQAQLQGTYFDAGTPSVQGQRKKIAAGNILVQASRGIKIGGSQPDGSTLSPPQLAPKWNDLTAMPDLVKPAYNSSTVPLYTGYNRVPISVGFSKTGQVALQQDDPLPMSILAIVSEGLAGDTPDQMVQKRQGRQQ
jgi:hypothetical protein